ncbi:MAG: AraC family transcriptional regulator [Clostridia bacterium]
MVSIFSPIYREGCFVPVVHAYYDRADMMQTTFELVSHSHSLCEIMYVNEGMMSLDVSGETLHIGRKQFIWIDANVYHRNMLFETKLCSVMNIEFQYEELDKRCPCLKEMYLCDSATAFMLEHPADSLVLTDTDDTLCSLMKQMILLADSTHRQQEQLCSMLCTQVMLIVAKRRKEQVAACRPIQNRYVSEAIDILEQGAYEPITAAQLAQQLHIQPTYLHRLFKEHTGQTIGDYVQHLRMKRAQELLEQTNQTLLDIACEVGFSSQQRFTQLFKRLVGVAPLEYRRQHGAKANARTRAEAEEENSKA